MTKGRLTDPRTVTVGREQLIARRAVVIANGSTAAIPPIPGLDTVDFWTNTVVVRADPAETARGYIHDFHGGAVKLVADR